MNILLSRYKIIKQIGTGGFGDTHLAEDTALPGNPYCVVKHLKKNPDPGVLVVAQRLFEEEAKALQNLGKHDQIPTLSAYFQENGEFYLVQEFVDGYDLNQEIIPGQKLSEKQTIELLKDILEILAIVHQENIIHRDIKPSNIMRRRQDGKIVLIDFGAVKEIGVFAVNSQGQTSLTVGIGTPGYMPDEQANGRPKLASDIYAVGMIGIQAITGLLPAQLQEDSNTGEIIWRNHAQVSDRFAEVLTNMVRDHFSQRYKNATEALQALIPPDKTLVSSPDLQRFTPKIMVSLGVAVAVTFAGGYIIKGYIINNSLSNQSDRNVPSSISTSSSSSTNSLNSLSEPENSPTVSTSQLTTKLTTTKGDFRNLEKFLAAKQWKEADQETWELMKKITNRKKDGWLRKEDYQNFPTEELRIMDELWVKHSNGLFGFSVQKKIWINLGGTPGVYNYDLRSKFTTAVEWKGLDWQLEAYTIAKDDIAFYLKIPEGQLPWGGYRDSMGVLEISTEPKDSMRSEEFYLSFILSKL